ncbi:MAG: UDP-N-acetylmuramate--L-alanine ligase [Brevinema sp.]
MISIKPGSHLFFIGIGGVGMSALALILKSRGFIVSGSDRSQSTVVDGLIAAGIKVYIGHNPKNITKDVKYVVYTNAVGETNPEMQEAVTRGIPCIVRAEMLNFVGGHYFSIGVSGTHGKTTTTSLTARIFLSAGVDPTLAVGGHLEEIHGAGYAGKGDTMIYEACEAFGSLAHLNPDMSLVTNIDEDHMEFFKNLGEVEDLFLNFFNNNLAAHSLLIYNQDDNVLRSVVEKSQVARRLSVSMRAQQGDFWCDKLCLNAATSHFDVYYKDIAVGSFTLNVPGVHNVSNAMLAIAAAKSSGIDNDSISQALLGFRNADRRFQFKVQSDELTVIDDYAHHPRAVALTLTVARRLALEKGAKLVVVFQPHLYSRTRYFYKEFSEALGEADSVILTDIYAAREPNPDNLSSQIILDEMQKIGKIRDMVFEKNMDNIPSLIKQRTNGIASVVITLGAGDVWKVSEKIFA